MRLPTYTGLELVRRIKQDPVTRSISVILYSNIATAEERIQAFELGAVDLLTKPFITAELIARARAALRAKHTMTMLEQRAHLDGLTGLANRAVLDDQLLREWDNCRRRNVPLTVAIFDLDRFKVINDTFGHTAGDAVLRQTARLLSYSARSSDLVARYGGEEFVVVASDCLLSEGVMLAERFRTSLHCTTIPVGDTDLSVTTSVGIATADGADSPEELVQQADEALYQAKHSGRDAVWVYNTQQRAAFPAVTLGSQPA